MNLVICLVMVKDNVVDFTKLNGIIGLFHQCISGKSALLDVLAFCLFDISTRAFVLTT